jgi:hypothetical protein
MRDQHICQKHHDSSWDSFAQAKHPRTLGGANYRISTRNRSFHASLPVVILPKGRADELLLTSMAVIVCHNQSLCDRVELPSKSVQTVPIIPTLDGYHTNHGWPTGELQIKVFRMLTSHWDTYNAKPNSRIEWLRSLSPGSGWERAPPQN